MNGGAEPHFDYPNEAVARTFAWRWIAICAPLTAAVAFVAINGITALAHGVPFIPPIRTLTFEIPAFFAIALALNGFMARQAILLQVPKSIAILPDRVVGDFRRPRWRGAPIREMMFRDVVAIRPIEITRVPAVLTRRDNSPRDPLFSPPKTFLVTKENQARIAEALAKFRRDPFVAPLEHQ